LRRAIHEQNYSGLSISTGTGTRPHIGTTERRFSPPTTSGRREHPDLCGAGHRRHRSRRPQVAGRQVAPCLRNAADAQTSASARWILQFRGKPRPPQYPDSGHAGRSEAAAALSAPDCDRRVLARGRGGQPQTAWARLSHLADDARRGPRTLPVA
jgi:hypothetical protein